MKSGGDKYRIAFSLRAKVILYFGLTNIITALITSIFIFYFMSRVAIEDLKSRIVTIASLAALQVDPEAFLAIKDRQDEDGPEYTAVVTVLRKIQDQDPAIKFIYAMRKTHRSDVLEFVVDAQITADANDNGMIEPEEEKAHVGEAYNIEEFGPKMMAAFDGPLAEDEVVHDRWGDLLSGYAPIKDAEGHTIGIVGVDFDAGSLKLVYRQVLQVTATAGALAAILWIAVALLFSYKLIKPLKQIRGGLQQLASGRNYVSVPVQTRDEFGVLATIVNDMSIALREKELYYNLLRRYLSPDVADEILKSDPHDLSAPSRKRVTILFADIWNFNAQTEKLAPEDVVEVLNLFFGSMVQIIYNRNGILDKFLGNGLMAVFGAPIAVEDQEFKAVAAALEMSEAMARIRASLGDAELRANLRLGIGINTGFAVVGNIGSEQRTEYTAIGDEVNLAHRIQAATRFFNEEVLVSATTMAATRFEFTYTEHREIPLPGVTQPLTLYAPRFQGPTETSK